MGLEKHEGDELNENKKPALKDYETAPGTRPYEDSRQRCEKTDYVPTDVVRFEAQDLLARQDLLAKFGAKNVQSKTKKKKKVSRR